MFLKTASVIGRLDYEQRLLYDDLIFAVHVYVLDEGANLFYSFEAIHFRHLEVK